MHMGVYSYVHIDSHTYKKPSTFDKNSVHYYTHFAKIPLPAPLSLCMDNDEEGNLLLLVNPTETEWEINVS